MCFHSPMNYLLALLLLFTKPLETPKERCGNMIQSAIEFMHNREHTQSLELLSIVQSLAKDNNWHKEHFLAVNNIGANYYRMSDYGEALKYYLEAYDIAISHLDTKEEMVVLNNIGILFYQEDNMQAAEAHFLKAYHLAKKHQDNFKTGLYAVNLGLALNKSNRLDEAAKYLETAIDKLQNNHNVLLQAEYATGENYFLKKEFTRAETYLLQLLPKLNKLEFLEQKTAALLMLSKIEGQRGDFQSAVNYASRARNPNNGLEGQIDINEQLAKLYFQNNNYERGWQHKDSVIYFKDSLFRVKSNAIFESSRVKLEIVNYQKELRESHQKFLAERRFYYALLGGALLLLLLLLWIWRSNIVKLKQKKIIADRNQKIKMLELEQELENRNRKLAVKALNMSSRNEILGEIITNLKNHPGIAAKPELLKYVSQLNKHIKTDSQWDDFFMHFEEANSGFLSNLKSKHPVLHANDVRFLSYVYMNLSIKEMATLLNITTDACRKRKERISKKIGLHETAELYDYLCKLQEN